MRHLIDCHVHTSLCGHACGGVPQYVVAAHEAGLAGLVFTEHLALPDALDPNRHLSMSPDALDGYIESVVRESASVPSLTVMVGAEVDWLDSDPEHATRMADVFRASVEMHAGPSVIPVILGSVHFLDGWAFDDPESISTWERADVDEVWRTYVRVWCEAASSGLFDVMAHPDLPKKFGHRPGFDPTTLFAQAAAAVSPRTRVEVGTAGLRKPVAELYPSLELLTSFNRAGVPIVFGSDAHAPHEVGSRFDAAAEHAAAAGYDTVGVPSPDGTWEEVPLS